MEAASPGGMDITGSGIDGQATGDMSEDGRATEDDAGSPNPSPEETPEKRVKAEAPC